MRVSLTAGQAGDNPQLLPLIDGIASPATGPVVHGHAPMR